MMRAIRRHHKKRVKRRARSIVRNCWCYTGDLATEVESAVVKNADNLKTCNGCCCKNPRRNGWQGRQGRMTVQERRQLQPDDYPQQ